MNKIFVILFFGFIIYSSIGANKGWITTIDNQSDKYLIVQSTDPDADKINIKSGKFIIPPKSKQSAGNFVIPWESYAGQIKIAPYACTTKGAETTIEQVGMDNTIRINDVNTNQEVDDGQEFTLKFSSGGKTSLTKK